MPIIEAARKLLVDCLMLAPGSEAIVLFDDSSKGVAWAVAEAATEVGIQVTLLFFTPQMEEAWSHDEVKLPDSLRAAIRSGGAAITALSGGTDTTGFRIRVAHECLDASLKLAHMPGITERVMATQSDVDYSRILETSERMRQELVGASSVEIVTANSDGERFTLTVTVEGRTPLKCGCRPGPGEITNVPCGEAFIAPVETSANGTIAINGAIPGLVVPPDEDLMLTFENGRLRKVHPEDTVCAQELQRIKKEAEQEGWEGWNLLCEVGIGTNPWIKKLTGISAVDEKAAGTIHVAIGENTRIGGKNRSPVHIDLVTTPLSVAVDGSELDLSAVQVAQG